MIDGVKIKALNKIADERGHLQEILRNDEEMFSEFGQVYFTTTYPNVVKGWHYHNEQEDNIVCVKGMIKLVLYDSREGSPTKDDVDEYFIGEHNPKLIKVPKGVYHGWMCISENTAYIINMPNKVYDYKNPDEVRVHPHKNDIPYEWARKDG